MTILGARSAPKRRRRRRYYYFGIVFVDFGIVFNNFDCFWAGLGIVSRPSVWDTDLIAFCRSWGLIVVFALGA